MGRCRNAMAVVGGGLVVTGAALIAVGIMGGIDLFEKSNNRNDEDVSAESVADFRNELLLPLPPTTSPVHRPSISPSESTAPSLRPSFSSRPSAHPSSGPTVTGRPTSMPSDSPSITSNPTVTPSSFPNATPSATPSTRPSASPSTSLKPTNYPTASPTTQYPTTSPTKSPSQKPTAKPTKLLYSLDPSGTFRLRLHWQEGFKWQNKTEETWFCMACAWCETNVFRGKCDIKNFCEEGMMPALVNCDPKKVQNKTVAVTPRKKRKDASITFTLVEGHGGLFGVADNQFEGDQVQVVETNLCLERVRARDIELKQCDASVKRQRFLGFEAGGQEMELHPEATFRKRGVEYERCLSQHHHPRQGERVYAETCKKTRRTKTSWWSTY